MEIGEDEATGVLEKRAHEQGRREGITRYEFPGELVEMEMRSERPMEGRLRGLYRRALVVRRVRPRGA